MSNNNERQVWANLPIHLSRKEMLNPFLFIKELYGTEIDLIDCRKYLKTWFRSAISNTCLLSKDQIVSLIWFKEYILKLVETGFVIYNDYPDEHPGIIITTGEDEAIIDPALYCDPQIKYYTGWDYFPRYLSRKEFINPYKVLKKLYSIKSLPEWRDVINVLFSDAITGDNACSDTDDDIWQIFEYLFKLVEAAHLIKIRASE